jgi:AcrR family transcriptional regulator
LATTRLTRAEKRAETRQRLLEAAAEVFMRRGFEAASIEEITAEAGYTRGAFYSNFESKEQMFVELLQERVYARFTDLLRRVPQDASPIEQLRWATRELVEGYRETEGSWLYTLFLECLAHAARDPAFRPLPAQFWKGTRAINAQRFESLYKERGRSLPVDARDLATAMIALDIGLAVQHLVDPEEVPLELYPPLFELLFGRFLDPARDPSD